MPDVPIRTRVIRSSAFPNMAMQMNPRSNIFIDSNSLSNSVDPINEIIRLSFDQKRDNFKPISSNALRKFKTFTVDMTNKKRYKLEKQKLLYLHKRLQNRGFRLALDLRTRLPQELRGKVVEKQRSMSSLPKRFPEE